MCVFFLIGATGEHKAEKPAEKERDAIKSEGWSQLQTKYDFQLISFLSVWTFLSLFTGLRETQNKAVIQNSDVKVTCVSRIHLIHYLKLPKSFSIDSAEAAKS